MPLPVEEGNGVLRSSWSAFSGHGRFGFLRPNTVGTVWKGTDHTELSTSQHHPQRSAAIM